MPVGLIVMRWDERAGTEIIAKYPEEINVTEKTLMQVYSTHEYSGESGLVSLMVGSLNIASYYTGSESSYYILLLLNLDDDPDAYEGGLADAARVILQNIKEPEFLDVIPSIFQRLSVYPSLNDEQHLIITYFDEVKRMIINRLRDEGVVSKSELVVWLKDLYKRGFADVDPILSDLVKRELIKETSVKGMPSELIFLTNDLLMARVPPVNLLKDPVEKGLPAHLVEDYITQCKKLFQNYSPTDEDNIRIANILVNPQNYEVLRLLRTAIVTKSELMKLKKKGVDNVDIVLKDLWESQMLAVFQGGQGEEYYALVTDFHLSLIFPKYLLRTIKQEYEVKSKSNKVLIEYLSVLESAYLDLKTKEKKKAKSKE